MGKIVFNCSLDICPSCGSDDPTDLEVINGSNYGDEGKNHLYCDGCGEHTEIYYLDYTSVAYVIHNLAGTVSNLRGCIEYLKAGKTHFKSTGRPVIDSALRDVNIVTNFIKKLKALEDE